MDFPSTFVEARRRFRALAERSGWRLDALAVDGTGPDGESLTIDVASHGVPEAPRLLVVSSGLHGVEGPFGSAVQTGLLGTWSTLPASARAADRSVRRIFIHALNPYGFAWSRRTDADNVDPNRNFLRPDEDYRGQAGIYARLDSLLNPRRPPSAAGAFALQMLIALARHGRPALKQAIVAGQYDFPQGLFFGGHAASDTVRAVERAAPAWMGQARLVLHLDLHTGLGPFATHKLLVDHELAEADRQRLVRWFGRETVEAGEPGATSYRARGSFAHWCGSFGAAGRCYLHACAEFGTYGHLRVLSALRAENQAHHWTRPGDPRRARATARLREVFCPASTRWRARVLADAVALVERGCAGLIKEPLP